MTTEILCSIELDCDVMVSRNISRVYSIQVRGCSKRAENFHGPEKALAALITVREAGYSVPPELIKGLAEKVVQATFKSGRL